MQRLIVISSSPKGDTQGFLKSFALGTKQGPPHESGASTSRFWSPPRGKGKVHIDPAVYGGNDRVFIHTVYVPYEYENRGLASRAMKWLTGLADKHNVTLVLNPFTMDSSRRSDKDLRSWYKRLGFLYKRESGLMVRPANSKPKI